MKKIAKGNSKGVTLIALIITVIVLTVLASVTVATISGDNGIITKAEEAKNASESSDSKENQALKNVFGYANEIINGKPGTPNPDGDVNGDGVVDDDDVVICSHIWDAGVVKTEPICIQEGVMIYVCSVCGTTRTESIPVIEHNYSVKSKDSAYLRTAATCTEDATYYYKCTMCTGKGTNWWTDTGSKLGHVEAYGGTQAIHIYCTRCNVTLSSTHTYNQKNTDSAYWKSDATCQVPTTYYYSCACGYSNKSTTFTVGTVAAHKYNQEVASDTYLATAADCTHDATYYHKCQWCNAKGTTTWTKTGTALGHRNIQYGGTEAVHQKCGVCGATTSSTHTYNQKVTTSTYWKSDATCQTPTTYYYSCACGYSNKSTTFTSGSVAAHNYNVQSTDSTYLKSAATCTADATYYYKCQWCSAKGTNSWTKTGTALGHSYGTPTYSWNGYTSCTASRTCSKCSGKETGTATITNAVTTAATCTTAGVRTYTAKFSNTAFSTQTKTEEVAKLAHSYTAQSTDSTYLKSAATCTANAVYYYKCSGCTAKGSNTWEKTGTATGHTYNQQNTSTAYRISTATCQKAATYYKSCSCGASSKGTSGEATFTSGNTVAHSYTYKSRSHLASSATCEEDATYYMECMWCTAYTTSQTWTDTGTALGHDYKLSGSAAATCKTNGYKEYTCVNGCGGSYTDTITATGHTPNEGTTTPATCLAAGATVYNCTVCGDETSRKTIAKLEHEYELSGSAAATCKTNGYKEYTCVNGCGGSYTDTITATGHTPNGGSTIAATCSTAGATVYNCTVCGEETSRTPIPATGQHSMVYDKDTGDHVEPTCTEDGLYYYVCGNSGCDYSETKVIGAMGHRSPYPDVDVKAGCKEEGLIEYWCDKCYALMSRTVLPAEGFIDEDKNCRCDDCGEYACGEYNTYGSAETCSGCGSTYCTRHGFHSRDSDCTCSVCGADAHNWEYESDGAYCKDCPATK